MAVSIRPFSQAFAFDVQWIDVFDAKHCNWVNFDFIKLACEYDKMHAHFEIEIALIGFYMRICIPLPDTEQSLALKSRIEEVKRADPESFVPFAEAEARIKAEYGVDVVVPADDKFKEQFADRKGETK